MMFLLQIIANVLLVRMDMYVQARAEMLHAGLLNPQIVPLHLRAMEESMIVPYPAAADAIVKKNTVWFGTVNTDATLLVLANQTTGQNIQVPVNVHTLKIQRITV